MISIPLTDLPDDFRAFAAEWCGFDVWRDLATHSPWWAAVDADDVLPISLPMGKALGVAYLAHKHGKTPQGGCRWYHFEDCWTLEHMDVGLCINFAGEDIPRQCVDVVVPALADCTDGTNPHRDEQALAACLRALTP